MFNRGHQWAGRDFLCSPRRVIRAYGTHRRGKKDLQTTATGEDRCPIPIVFRPGAYLNQAVRCDSRALARSFSDVSPIALVAITDAASNGAELASMGPESRHLESFTYGQSGSPEVAGRLQWTTSMSPPPPTVSPQRMLNPHNPRLAHRPPPNPHTHLQPPPNPQPPLPRKRCSATYLPCSWPLPPESPLLATLPANAVQALSLARETRCLFQ
jgi:hypothetical protein